MRARATLDVKKPLFLVITNEQIAGVLRDTENYLDSDRELFASIEELFFVYHIIEDLIPWDLERWGSGHFFPISEGSIQLQSCYQLVARGFYREGVASLRNLLELGLMSVFWDKADTAHIAIRNWVTSQEDTPFKNRIVKGLLEIPNVLAFQGRVDLESWIKGVYERLSNYVHIRGMRYSNHGMWRSNVPRLNSKALVAWCKLAKATVQVIAVVHILKYPVALQHTPVGEKFGLDAPIGTFLNPWQAARLREFVPPAMLDVMQAISDGDSNAVALSKWVNEKADVTEEEFEAQAERQDRYLIESSGWRSWYSSYAALLEHADGEDTSRRLRERLKSLEAWARINGHYDA